MKAYDVIDKKKKGMELSEQEINFLIQGYVDGKIPDYQMSAWLMAVYFQGMTDRELLFMTKCMAESGDQIDLSMIQGVKVDKHSTGGVGDKVTLVVAPIVAACGGKVAKMSGRGLGFTGGTIDKLESVPGFQTSLSEKDFFHMVNEKGLAVMGQSADVAPADKKIYALRDVTATVDNIPLIASSIMSKKLAAGSDKIVLDVTVGSGAFMKNMDDAVALAEKMVTIGEGAGRETVAVLTNMDMPLGCAAGNTIEMIEAIHTLQGNGPEDLTEVCKIISVIMLTLAGVGSQEICRQKVEQVIRDGSALQKLIDMVKGQGGDASYICHPEKFNQAEEKFELKAWKEGCITWMDTECCGKAAVILGAGRETKESKIDMTAGIHFLKKTGDTVTADDIIAILHSSSMKKIEEGVSCLKDAIKIEKKHVKKKKAILGYVTKNGVERYDN